MEARRGCKSKCCVTEDYEHRSRHAEVFDPKHDIPNAEASWATLEGVVLRDRNELPVLLQCHPQCCEHRQTGIPGTDDKHNVDLRIVGREDGWEHAKERGVSEEPANIVQM